MAAWRLYLVVAGGGAVVMALEILAGRMMTPTFGNSVYVWGSAISVFLAALALGYVLGGALVDRTPKLLGLARLLGIAAATLAVLVFVADAALAWMSPRLGSSPLGPLVAATLLFGPTIVLLGTASPFAIRLAARDLTALGNLSGRLFALSTAGSLAGTLACTFLLIPFFDQRTILELLLLATLAVTLVAASERPAESRSLFLLAAVLAIVPLLPSREGSDPELLTVRLSPYQTIEVRERLGQRILYSDGVTHSALELETGLPALTYPRYSIAALLFSRPENALVLGLGGGTTGRYLRRGLPELEIDYVEIDPAIADVAERFLGFEPGPSQRLHIADGRRFLADSERRWDLIFVDTYLGLSVPFHLTTIEFFRLVRSRLGEDGVVAVNFAAPPDQPFTGALMATLQRVFPQVYLFDVPTTANVVVVATVSPDRRSQQTLLARARELDPELPFEPTLEEVARRLVELDISLDDEQILRDQHAPVDRLLHLGRRPQ